MSKSVIKVIFLILFVLVLVASWYYGGFFTRYNYLTAKWDVYRNKPTLVEYGEPYGLESELKDIASKTGINYDYVGGCVISSAKANGIACYNKVITPFLTSKLGRDWKENLYKHADSLYYLDRIEAMKNAVFVRDEIRRLEKYVDSASNGKARINIWVSPQSDYYRSSDGANVTVGWIASDSSKIELSLYAVNPHTLTVSYILF